VKTTEEADKGGAPPVRGFRIAVVEGADAGAEHSPAGDRCAIGTHESNDVRLSDPTCSRFHCEIVSEAAGTRLRDLGSLNGTSVDGVQIVDCWLRSGAIVRLGNTAIRFEHVSEAVRLPLSERTEFGSLVGRSVAMRSTFALLERAAASDATLLIEGETGTGKQGAAEAIHAHGSRRDRPFVTVDCGGLPETLLDSELWGHEEGAFTDARRRRIGAFEAASGGTLFLDEVGELPPDLQPKLLRALESRQIRRLGSNDYLPIDVRVIAATNRDLRAEVNAKRFRSDLYFRLAVVKIRMPPLRQRPEDIPPLVEALLDSLDAPSAVRAQLTSPAQLAQMARASWAGNVRELRNYLHRCLVFDEAMPVQSGSFGVDAAAPRVDPRRPWQDERERVLAEFERSYLTASLALHGGKASAAARTAGVARVYFYKLLRRHGLTPGDKE
jgi:DNA-binding NtrC family response regulator